MNMVKIFDGKGYYGIEEQINAFARKYEIINASITSHEVGYSTYYTVIVVYKA